MTYCHHGVEATDCEKCIITSVAIGPGTPNYTTGYYATYWKDGRAVEIFWHRTLAGAKRRETEKWYGDALTIIEARKYHINTLKTEIKALSEHIQAKKQEKARLQRKLKFLNARICERCRWYLPTLTFSKAGIPRGATKACTSARWGENYKSLPRTRCYYFTSRKGNPHD